MASINSLGITFAGAESKLNSELIDKLKEADKTAFLAPTESALEQVKYQQDDFASLKELLTTLSDSGSVFSDELTYLKRNASASGDGAYVYADDGVDPQSGNIHINTIAKQGVVESKGFATSSTIVNTTGENQVLKLSLNGQEYKIDIVPNMTLDDLKSQITDSTDGNVIASVLDTGGDNPYKLILKSKDTGSDQNIQVIIDDEATFDLDLTTIQEASDASFTYNGVTIQRDTNTIEDLFIGIKLELLKDNSDISFQIERDLTGMAEDMNTFVEAYNEASDFLSKITTYNEDDEEAGHFFGDYRINSIQSQLNNVLFQYIDSKTMTDYGLSLSEYGKLTFDSTTFNEKIQEDPEGAEDFFRGGTNITPSTYTSKSIGVTYTAHSTTVDGKQVTTFIESAMSEDVTIPKGSIKINDIELGEIKLLASNTPSQNAMIVATAVNAIYDETNVHASLSANGSQIFFSDESGENFSITSSDGSAEKIGLETGTYVGKIEEFDGVFSKVDTYFENLMENSDSSLTLLETGLGNTEKRLTDETEAVLERLNSKYDLMALQFASYNSLISSYESSFQSIQMQIDAMNSSN